MRAPRFRTIARKTSAPPAMTSAHCRRTSQGTRRQSARAPRRQMTPAGKAQRRAVSINVLTFPPLRVEGAQGEEESEGRHRDVVDDVLGVDDAFAEAVHVLDNREILQQRAELAA